jgi:hypothetical protein
MTNRTNKTNMTNDICDKIRLLLVDYSDEELTADQARQISDHLSQCTACHEELRLLERSLELARVVWQEGEADVLNRTRHAPRDGMPHAEREEYISRRARRPRSMIWIGGSLAVCAVIVLGVLLQTFFMRTKSPGTNPQSIASAGSNSTQPKEEMDVMEYIAREGRSARLAASVELLAAQPGLERYKESTERYLKETYADTNAARMLNKQ